MTVWQLAGAGLTLGMATFLLGRLGKGEVAICAAVGAAVLLSVGMGVLSSAFVELLPLGAHVGERALVSVSKALAVGYVSGISADLCEDLGQAGVARAITFGGRAMIFSLCVPYLTELVGLCEELIG